AGKIIFKHCFNLRYASYGVKRKFIAENCTRPELEKYFVTHLNFVDYRIKYDEKLLINSYVAEVLPQILDFSDNYNKVLLRADTGRGKTTAFIKDFQKHRPNSRLLILVPLTIISDQNEKDYGSKVVFLTGQSDGFAHEKARKANIVLATYEQGTKHLAHHTFDYLVIDEAHQLIVANSFKANVIRELTALFKESKIIGLTGTPSEVFSLLGYKLLDVDVEKPKQM
ncbi:MAG: DEAD/DEAH box helicase family protein, partial [Bacteroidales bacterium]|nr:DEAD/DEAH box helicase family protein [Bacteroidales bacterium]